MIHVRVKLIKHFRECKKKPENKSRRKAFFRSFNAFQEECEKLELSHEEEVHELFPSEGIDGMLEMLSLILKHVDMKRSEDYDSCCDAASTLTAFAATSIDMQLK